MIIYSSNFFAEHSNAKMLLLIFLGDEVFCELGHTSWLLCDMKFCPLGASQINEWQRVVKYTALEVLQAM